ncbi:hypothetical protein EJ110_NYTH44217 [Nymphaea thermarum]|nr:hypothetical protein EJ110_NYTH44217 [Nymphaea thermarum]
MAPRKAKTIEPETVVVEGEQVVVEGTRIVERGEPSGTNSKLDLILNQLAGVNQTIANIDGRLNTLEQRRNPPRSHTSSYYHKKHPIGAVSEAFLVDARRVSLRGQGVEQPPRAHTHVPQNEPIQPPNQRQIIHHQLTNGTNQPGAQIHVGERARQEGERPTPEEIRRDFLEQRQNHERQHHDKPYQNLGPHHEGPRRHHENRSMQSMTLGEFEEELDREIEMMNGQGRGQCHAGFNHGRKGRNHEKPRLPMPKIDFPKFNGKRPKEWVYKAEQYFICQEIAEQHKIRLAKMYLEEEAMLWYCFWEEDYPNATWDLFKDELLLQFGETTYVNHEIELRNLKQTSTVQDYQGKFERLCSMVKNRPEDCKIAHFIGGLDEDIQIEMLRDPPTELRKCFALAKTIEEQLKRREARKKAYKPGFASKPKPNFVKSALPQKKKQVEASMEAGQKSREANFPNFSSASIENGGHLHCEVKSSTKAGTASNKEGVLRRCEVKSSTKAKNKVEPSRERVERLSEAKRALRVEDLGGFDLGDLDPPGLGVEGLGKPSLDEEDPDPLSPEEDDLGTPGLDDGGLGLERSTRDPDVDQRQWARTHLENQVDEGRADPGEVGPLAQFRYGLFT